MACACIAAARRIVKVSPMWCNELVELTGTELDYECFNEVFAYYQETFALSENKHNPEPTTETSKARHKEDKENTIVRSLSAFAI